jgi:hypothetical protein
VNADTAHSTAASTAAAAAAPVEAWRFVPHVSLSAFTWTVCSDIVAGRKNGRKKVRRKEKEERNSDRKPHAHPLTYSVGLSEFLSSFSFLRTFFLPFFRPATMGLKKLEASWSELHLPLGPPIDLHEVQNAKLPPERRRRHTLSGSRNFSLPFPFSGLSFFRSSVLQQCLSTPELHLPLGPPIDLHEVQNAKLPPERRRRRQYWRQYCQIALQAINQQVDVPHKNRYPRLPLNTHCSTATMISCPWALR